MDVVFAPAIGTMVTSNSAPSFSSFSANVNGSPVLRDGINATLGSNKSRSSSAREFLLASASTRVTGTSSPEFHSSSDTSMDILPKANPTRIVAGVSL